MEELKNVLNLKIDINVWEKFKRMVDRDTSLNDAVVMLIHAFVNKGTHTLDSSTMK